MQKKMRFGYTTGSCAAAGTKAALLACIGRAVPQRVEVLSPQGERIAVPVKSVAKTEDGYAATIVKDGGDDPDITHGAEIVASVQLRDDGKIILDGGVGVGRVTKAGLSVPVGEAAINPGPRQMIYQAVRDVLGGERGCEITICVPCGEQLAKHTLNASLGIVGGISIIGTSGIVRPMSEEAFKKSLEPQICVAMAAGFDTLVLVPGKIGETAAVQHFAIPRDCIVQTSNFIGHMLECCVREKVKSVVLFGHIGKLAKVAAGVFHTHNRMADARMEAIAAYAASLGASRDVVREILASVTTEAVLPLLEKERLTSVYTLLAERAAARMQRYVFSEMETGAVIVTLKGELLGCDESAVKIGGRMGWKIKR